jgi:hypothetical protein
VERNEEKSVALTLFVARVLANDADHALPADDAAGFTELFDRRTDFHGKTKRGREKDTVCSHPPARLTVARGPDDKTKTPPRPMMGRGGEAIRSIPALLGKCRIKDF